MEKNSQKRTSEKEDYGRATLWIGAIILIIGIPIIVIAPYILTKLLAETSFSTTGQIGDTIGGITAPFVNLLSAILIFLALWAQIKANKIIQGQFTKQKDDETNRLNFAKLLEMNKLIKEDLNNFITQNPHIDKGKSSLSMFFEAAAKEYHKKRSAGISDALWNFSLEEFYDKIANEMKEFKEYKSIIPCLKTFELLTESLNFVELTDEDKRILVSLVNLTFESNITAYVPTKCPTCSDRHQIFPDELYQPIENIKKNLASLKKEINSSKLSN